MDFTEKVKKRFWAKVKIADPDNCWEWQAGTISCGYGRFAVTRKSLWLAHRVSYAMTNGAIPEGLFVMHKCDNRLCVNPQHLTVGTNQDNMNDMKAKGRTGDRKGMRNGRSKLTDAEIIEIRSLRGIVTRRELTERFSVAKSLIDRILDGQAWTHIPSPSHPLVATAPTTDAPQMPMA